MRIEILTLGVATLAGWLGSAFIARDFAKPPEPEPSDFQLLPLTTSRSEAKLPPLGKRNGFATAADFADSLAVASAADLERWLLDLIREPQAGQWTNTVLKQFASLDPERALEFLNQHWIDKHGSLRDARRTVIGVWAQTDTSAAVDKALAIDPEGEILPLFDPLPTDKAEELFQILTEKGLNKSGYFGNLLSMMSRDADSDPKLLATRAMDIRDYGDRSLQAAMGSWAERDREGALAWIDSLEDSVEKRRATLALAKGIGGRDLVAGLDVAWSRLSPEEQMRLVRDLSWSRSNQNTTEVLAWLDENVTSPGVHAAAVGTLVEMVGRSEQPESIAEVITRTEGSNRQLQEAVFHATKAWVAKDETSARDWINSLEEQGLRNAALNGLAHASLDQPLEAARILREEIQYPEDPDDIPQLATMTQNLAVSLGNQGFDPAAVIEAYPEVLRRQAASDYLQAFASHFPEKVLTFIEKEPLDGGIRYAVRDGLNHWFLQDESAATAWVEQLEEGELRNLATPFLVETWAQEEPEAAIAWLDTQPEEAAQQGTAQLAQYFVPIDSERAFGLAQSLTDARARDETTSEIVSTVASRNPAQAGRLLEQATLSASARETVSKQLEEIKSFTEALAP